MDTLTIFAGRTYRSFLVLLPLGLLLLALSPLSQAQNSPASAPLADSTAALLSSKKLVIPSPLFSSDQILELTLSFDFKALLRDRGEKTEYHPAVLSYQNVENDSVAIDLRVKVRGNNRRMICSFPPLMLNFSKNTGGTLFSGQNKLKLVTHCRNDEYVVKEFQVYKVYNLLSNKSFRTRLCRINYVDPANRKIIEQKYAFLLEDEEEMASRISGTAVPPEIRYNMDYVNPNSMATLALFQYMIGNCDWSVPYRHNIKIVSVKESPQPFPVPYDFDHSGIVHTPYAKPPEELGIKSVRERLYRSFCFKEEEFTEAITRFNEAKEGIYSLYLNNELLSPAYIKSTTNFLNAFYKTINDPKLFKAEIIRACKANEGYNVVVKGLNPK